MCTVYTQLFYLQWSLANYKNLIACWACTKNFDSKAECSLKGQKISKVCDQLKNKQKGKILKNLFLKTKWVLFYCLQNLLNYELCYELCNFEHRFLLMMSLFAYWEEYIYHISFLATIDSKIHTLQYIGVVSCGALSGCYCLQTSKLWLAVLWQKACPVAAVWRAAYIETPLKNRGGYKSVQPYSGPIVFSSRWSKNSLHPDLSLITDIAL